MMAQLARFSFGRVLLHLISMLGDRAVRFHGAGIMRELSRVAEGTALLARVCTRLVNAFALYVAPRGKHYGPSTSIDPLSLAKVLLPGNDRSRRATQVWRRW
jgi:hypothetical protein